MQGRVMLLMVSSVLVLSGCAGQRSAQQLERLQSDVALLDQRVSQLERTALTPAATDWPAETQAPSVAPSSGSITVDPATSALIKPSKQEIQQALKNVGFYNGPIDGRIGSQTREAIRQFQQVNGLKVDGVVGSQTWKRLAPYLDLSAPSGELSAAEPLK